MNGNRLSRWLSAMVLHKCPLCGAHMDRWDVYGGLIVWRNRICPVCQYDAQYDGCWVEHTEEDRGGEG
jgi:hypothetical protein